MKSEQATRRSVLTGVVVSALAGAAAVNVAAMTEGSILSRPLNSYPVVFPPAPDPIYRVLESYQTAYDRWVWSLDYCDVPSSHPKYRELNELQYQISTREKDACDAVAACVPTTMAGLLAFVRFFETFRTAKEYELFACDADEFVETILKTVRTSLEGMEVAA